MIDCAALERCNDTCKTKMDGRGDDDRALRLEVEVAAAAWPAHRGGNRLGRLEGRMTLWYFHLWFAQLGISDTGWTTIAIFASGGGACFAIGAAWANLKAAIKNTDRKLDLICTAARTIAKRQNMLDVADMLNAHTPRNDR